MTLPIKKRKKDRKKTRGLIALAILGSHGVVFFLLAQCQMKAPGHRSEISYIRVPDVEGPELSFDFEEPPKRMFYQFATMPLVSDERELVPLTEPTGDGYEVLLALEVAESLPSDDFRLTLEMEDEAEESERGEPRKSNPSINRPLFLTVDVDGVAMQPVSSVPEPGSVALFGLATLGGVLRRRR